jgi:hypothetical protein
MASKWFTASVIVSFQKMVLVSRSTMSKRNGSLSTLGVMVAARACFE